MGVIRGPRERRFSWIKDILPAAGNAGGRVEVGTNALSGSEGILPSMADAAGRGADVSMNQGDRSDE